LQSGSDEVLRLMRRHYDTALFRHKIEKVRQEIPDAFIGVDLIVGARGETEQEFENSCRFIESLDISRLHVFTYSERPGTKALEIPHQVSQHDKHVRTHRVLQISERKLRDFSQRFVGTVRPVLLEHPRPGMAMTGFTDNYLKVRVDAPAHLDNTLVDVELISVSDDGEEMTTRLIGKHI
jgi:threonylcarbamoyladenosine tRNA methylthiotransferase MtaB